MNKNILSAFLLSFIALMGTAKSAVQVSHETKDVSIFIYYSGDNRLSDFMHSSYLRVLREGASSNVNVVIQFDGSAKNDSFRVELGSTKKNDHYEQTYYTKNVEYDMGKTQTLADFVKWGKEKFPSKRTFLVISSHGFGILNNPYPSNKNSTAASLASSIDDTSHSFMAEEDMAQKLKVALNGEKLDLLVHNSCLMGSLETLTIMSQIAKFAITSEYSIYMNTNDDLVSDEARTILIERIVHQVKQNPKVTELDIGRKVIADFGVNYKNFQAPTDQQEAIRYPSTLAFYDLHLMPSLALLYSELTKMFREKASLNNAIFTRFFDENLKARYVDNFGYIDLRSLYQSLMTSIYPGVVSEKMQSFETLIQKVVPVSVELYTSQTVPVAHLHAFFPSILTQADLKPFRQSYSEISTVQFYEWPLFLDFFWSGLEKNRDAYWIAKLQAWAGGATIIVKPTSDSSSYDYDLFLQLSMMAIRLKKIEGQAELKKYLLLLNSINRPSVDLRDHRNYVSQMLK